MPTRGKVGCTPFKTAQHDPARGSSGPPLLLHIPDEIRRGSGDAVPAATPIVGRGALAGGFEGVDDRSPLRPELFGSLDESDRSLRVELLEPLFFSLILIDVTHACSSDAVGESQSNPVITLF